MREFLLTILIIPIIATISMLSYWLVAILEFYWVFYGLFFVPGLIFSLVVWLIKRPETMSISAGLTYLLSSTLLYSIVFFVNMMMSLKSVWLIPGIGAVIFMGLTACFFGTRFSILTFFLSLLAGPVSGGITIWLMESNPEFGSLFFLPIILWWIYMAILIDLATLKRTRHV